MSSDSAPRGVLDPDPNLDGFQVEYVDRCWWCGDAATTEEHRIKASTLRRVAIAEDGTVEARNVFKKSSDFEGTLRSLRKGGQVRWRKNMCASCNGARSQPFDRAYDTFEMHLVKNFNVIADQNHFNWFDVFGDGWQTGAANLARYFGKQLGCMLATYDLPLPDDLVPFLDGAPRCPSIEFTLAVNPFVVAEMRAHPDVDFSTFVGLPEAPAYQTDARFSGVDYQYHIGYMNFLARWRADEDMTSWFEQQSILLPRFLAE